MAGRRRLTGDDFDESKMGPNPFLESLVIYTREVSDGDDLLKVSRDSGVVVEVEGKINITRSFFVEQQEFTKVYRSADHRRAVASLPSRAKELLCWLQFTIRPGKDYVIINIELYKEENNCSHSTYSRAVEDLILARILYTTRSQVVFWVNPAYMFCGNRLAKYPDNRTDITSHIRPVERVDELR